MQFCMDQDIAGILIGTSKAMTQVRNLLQKIASANCNTLITGETGTGKELAAQVIHHLSRRRSARLVSFNCAAVPDSLIESELFGYEKGAFTGAYQRHEGRMAEANGGTLFLDEIGEMTLFAQAKILRSLETRELQRLGNRGAVPIDIRIVAATNQNLEEMTAEGRFRKDLYFRLNVARVHLPPLRERSSEIPELARHFLQQLGKQMTRPPLDFHPEALDVLLKYRFPGNVRELRNLIEAALIHEPYPLIEARHWPEHLQAEGGWQDDRTRILHTLRVTNWNKSEAAKQLDWSRMTLYRKMARYAIVDEHKTQARC